MRIFLDVNMPPGLAELIKLLQVKRIKNCADDIVVEVHREHFPADMQDVEWLAEVGKWNPKPSILTYDGRILRRRIEYEVLRKQDLTIVDLKDWSQLQWNLQLSKLAMYWPNIIAVLDKTSRPTVYYLNKNGKIVNMGRTREYRR